MSITFLSSPHKQILPKKEMKTLYIPPAGNMSDLVKRFPMGAWSNTVGLIFDV